MKLFSELRMKSVSLYNKARVFVVGPFDIRYTNTEVAYLFEMEMKYDDDDDDSQLYYGS